MSEQQIAVQLRKLGFGQEAADLYVALLRNGPLTLEAVSSRAGLKPEEAVPFLVTMISNRLVFEHKGQYWVLNPKKAFKSLSDEVLWSVTSTTSDSLEDVPEDQVTDVREKRQACQILRSLAGELYIHRSPIAVGKIEIARNPNQLAALLTEAIDKAQDQVLCISTSPRQPQLSVIWNSILSRIQAGVKYKRIVDLREIVEHGYKIVTRDVEEVGVELYVAERDLIDRKFYVVDEEFVVMFAPNRRNLHGFSLTGQVISNKMIVKDYRRAFETLMAQSTPAAFVLRLMAEERKNLLSRAATNLNGAQVRWLKCLVDFGMYCKFSEFDSSDIRQAISRASLYGLVETHRIGPTTKPLPKYSWSMSEICSKWSAMQQR